MGFLRLLSPGDPGSNGSGDPAREKTEPDPAKAGAKPDNKADHKVDPGTGKSDVDPKVAEARQEAISERKKRQDLETRLADIEAKQRERDANLAKALGLTKDEDPTEALNKARKEKDDALGKAREALLRSAVTAESARQGAVDPEAVYKLGEWKETKVDLDSGKVEGHVEMISGLLKNKPFLLAKGPGGTPKPNAAGVTDPNPAAGKKEELLALAKKASRGDQMAMMEAVKRMGEFSAAGLKPHELLRREK